ncbi:MAG TPA: TolC family protein [Vicinamibacterales bacterium]
MKAIPFKFISMLFVFAVAAPAQAQSPLTLPRTSPFAGGVPSGTATTEPITLTIVQAVQRSLDHNLGVIMAEQGSAAANGDRLVALSRLLPNVSGSVTESRRKINLEAFGFPLQPGFPRVVGPFNVFDARVFASQAIFDSSASNDHSAAVHRLEAARHNYREARSIVLLASANAYLQALAAQAQAAAAAAQLTSSQAIHQQAIDLRSNGIVAGLDVVRAEVRVSLDRQRSTAASNDAQKRKLELARLIGLPLGQEFTLVDNVPLVPETELTLQAAVDQAYANRSDYQAALEEQKAAEASRRAAAGERLPSVHVNADYGAIGLTAASSLPTFNVTGTVEVPIFDGNRTGGRVAQATAELKRRTAAVEDLKASVYYDVRTAFLDLEATRQQRDASARGRELAEQSLQQSRDRFAAGVATNIEVFQAQEALAVATEQAISAQYGFSVAKALLAQSMGNAEQAFLQAVKGSTP